MFLRGPVSEDYVFAVGTRHSGTIKGKKVTGAGTLGTNCLDSRGVLF